MDINVLTCHINGRVETESNFPPHDIRRTLIRRGIVVKSQDPGTQFCHITATADTVRHRPATLSGDGEQAIIDNGSITQVFLLVDAERAACINVELPHKALHLSWRLRSRYPSRLCYYAVRQSRFLALTNRHWQYFLCLTPEYYRG